MLAWLRDAGFEIAYPDRRAGHEFIVTLRHEAREYGTNAMDFAKRLLDYGFHAPTTYFPLLVPECLLIEPTETESKQELDAFVEAMIAIRAEIDAVAQGRVWTGAQALERGLVDRVGSYRDALQAAAFDLAVVASAADLDCGVRLVIVNKQRRRFRVGDLRAESTDITITETGAVLHTLSIEGDDLDQLRALRRRLGLHGHENVAVHNALGLGVR